MNTHTIFRKIKWVLVNGGLVVLLWHGLVNEHEGAKNLGLFLAWLSFFVSFTAMSDAAQKVLREKGRSVPHWADTAMDLFIAGFLVWHGALWTGIAYTSHWLLMAIAWDQATTTQEAAQ